MQRLYITIPLPKPERPDPRRDWDAQGLACPSCASQRIRSIETRPHAGTNRRRRECRACGHRFWTVEVYGEADGSINTDYQMKWSND